MRLTRAAVLALVAVACVPATAQRAPTPAPQGPVPTPAEEHVVAPSLPDQPNKEGVARPSGPAEVKAAYLSLRGRVKAYSKGVSITIVEKDGVERTVRLAAKVSVYDGLAAGDKVVLRVPLQKDADGMSTDRISRQKPPKAPRKSKFSAAQSPAR